VALYARAGTLESASLALFHPIGFMLAQPLPTSEEIVETLPPPFAVEDKYDGIRAQAHVGAGRVALFSRTLDEITHGYPDVAAALATLPPGIVLDGELLAVDPADPRRALPFKALQRRLGRKSPSEAMLAEVPAAFVAYDIIAADGTLVIDEPYRARRARLEAFGWPERGAALAPVRLATTAEEVERAFDAARAAGNEGIIAKALDAAYTPGRRGKTWIKLKKATATLDVVVTGVERGHGRRRGVLSDYTFAVRASESDPTLLNVGKAYNGLTDAEITELTQRFEALTVQRFGRYHQVRPEVVLEVTFDIVQPSARHKAGYALRFPRIVRVRDDKPASEVDTLARVRELAGEGGAAAGPDGDDAVEPAGGDRS
jgi:DNA ligase-1